MRMLTYPSQATNRRLVVTDNHYFWLYDMPASEQDIELTVGGVIRRGTIKIPAMRMMLRSLRELTSDVANYLYVIPPDGAKDDIGLMPFTMANVDRNAAICYGNGNQYPQDPFEAWTNFWQSTFNDHLMHHVNYLNDNHIRMYVEAKGLVSQDTVALSQKKRDILNEKLGSLVLLKGRIHQDLERPMTEVEKDIHAKYDAAVAHVLSFEKMVVECDAVLEQNDQYRSAVARRKREYIVRQYEQAIKRRRIFDRRRELATNFTDEIVRRMCRFGGMEGIYYDEGSGKIVFHRDAFLKEFNRHAYNCGYKDLREYKRLRSVTFWRVVHRCCAFLIETALGEVRSRIERMNNPVLEYIQQNGGTRGLAAPFVDWWFMEGGWQTKLKKLEAPPISPAAVRHVFDLDKYNTRSFLFLRARAYDTANSPPEHTVLNLATDRYMAMHATYMIPVERNNEGFFIDGKESYYKYKVKRGRGEVLEVEKAVEISKAAL